ncbi:MAG: hypothetical protein GX633_02890 [Clostridiales bacterium]|nr:hypothetical protein [Clostridiales bacterium]
MYEYKYNGKLIHFVCEIYYDIAPYLAGITMKEFFLDIDKNIDAWKFHQDFVRSNFGEYLKPSAPTAPHLSYGHLACLGCKLNYTETGEPNVLPAVDSIDEAIELLKEKRDLDFTKTEIWQSYQYMSDRVREVFPQSPKFGGFGMEGPLTSAALLRGHGFYYDIMDEPEKCEEFLYLLTDSIIAFRKALDIAGGGTGEFLGGVGCCDDLASMIPPSMWETHVIPFWKQYYDGLTKSPNRSMHVEALKPAQVKKLDLAGLSHYQPSVSPDLTIESVQENTSLPFDWLLYAFKITDMTDDEIAAWQDDTLSKGITSLRTQLGKFTVESGKLDRVLQWFKAADRYRV